MILDTLNIEPERLGRQLDREEIHAALLEILDALVDFCDRNGLRYYLCGGTLLGAVRHKGFIPWDDDIDLNMPRPDADRLIELTQGVLNDHIEIASPFGPVPHAVGFLRACDKRYILHSSTLDGKSSYYTNLFVDIFPIEGLPTNMLRVRGHYAVAKSLITMRKLAYFQGVPGRMCPTKALRLHT